MVVRTFLPYSKIVKKPVAGMPGEIKTLGDHLRAKRLSNGQTQRDVAEFVGVSEDAVTYWENNRSHPQVQHYPKIIRFLGYYPFREDVESVGSVLLMCRYLYGFDRKRMAELIGVDVSRIRKWELGIAIPTDEILYRYYDLAPHFLVSLSL